MAPPKKPKQKVKHFKCPHCNTIETQEAHTVAVSHTHEGRIYKCEETDAEGNLLQPRMDKRARRKGEYIDGINGAVL